FFHNRRSPLSTLFPYTTLFRSRIYQSGRAQGILNEGNKHEKISAYHNVHVDGKCFVLRSRKKYRAKNRNYAIKNDGARKGGAAESVRWKRNARKHSRIKGAGT